MAWVESHEDVMRMEEEWLQLHPLDGAREHGDAIERDVWRRVSIVPPVELPAPDDA